MPSYVSINQAWPSDWTWADNTDDVRALQKTGSSRIAATGYSPTSFDIDLNFSDGAYHQVAFYVLDWDRLGRSQRFDIINADTGATIDSQPAYNLQEGYYLKWKMKGHVIVRVINLAGGSTNAVVSGIFFDPSPCFIATAAYGSSMEPQVQSLRNYRDSFLLTNSAGQEFVDWYYHTSPPIADELRKHDGLRSIVRAALTPLVKFSEWWINK